MQITLTRDHRGFDKRALADKGQVIAIVAHCKKLIIWMFKKFVFKQKTTLQADAHDQQEKSFGFCVVVC